MPFPKGDEVIRENIVANLIKRMSNQPNVSASKYIYSACQPTRREEKPPEYPERGPPTCDVNSPLIREANGRSMGKGKGEMNPSQSVARCMKNAYSILRVLRRWGMGILSRSVSGTIWKNHFLCLRPDEGICIRVTI